MQPASRLVLIAVCLSLTTCLPAQDAVTRVEESTDTEYSIRTELNIPDPWPVGGSVRVLFDQTDSGDGYALLLEKGRCRFVRTDGGQTKDLGAAASISPPPGQCDVVIKRRLARMTALVNESRAATAADSAFHGGAIAWSATHEPLDPTDVLVQPVAPVVFQDDFTRENETDGVWEHLAGEWKLAGIKTKESDPKRSANPFSLRGQPREGNQFALTTSGDWFWDDYRVAVAVKPQGPGAIGVAAYVQDAENMLLFRWLTEAAGEGDEQAPATGTRQLVRVRDGQWDVLDESPGAFQAERFYELGVTVCDGRLTAEVDGQVVARAYDTSLGQGGVGLFCAGPEPGYFDDVDVRGTRDHRDPFATNALGWWLPQSGKWSPRLEHLYGSAGRGKSAHATVGDAEWSRYRISASVKPKDAAAVGLTACRRADGAHYALRWQKNGRLALSLEHPDSPQTLAEASLPRTAAKFHAIGLEVGQGHIAALIDGVVVLEAADVSLASGPAGMLVDGPGEACFDDVSVTFDEERPPYVNITTQFTKEDTMESWVDASRQWRRAEDDIYWYDVPMFGDFTLWLAEADLAKAAGKLILVVAPQAEESPASWAEITTMEGSAVLRAGVGCGDDAERQAEGQVELEGRRRVSLVRKGSCLSVCVDGVPIAALADPDIRGRGVGLKLAGFPAPLSQVRVSSPHLVDVTFGDAPTDWRPQFGVWEITARWPCAPGWSWFGGSKHQSPLLWSKDIFEGDQVLEFWVGLLMDKPPPGYTHPSDINAILCGDGENLCSGYSFILAGDNNQRSKILKGNDLVALNTLVKFINPVSDNFEFHRHWFDIRIEKSGDHITYMVDGKLVAEWNDPEPLAGGRVGFWSWQENGILIARARMAAERIHR